jgi:hypothetical protein
MPAAVMGDMCVCVGPPDTVVRGSIGVMIGGKPAARMGDQCVHGGAIVVGCPTVLIGEAGGGGAGSPPPPNSIVPKLINQQLTPRPKPGKQTASSNSGSPSSVPSSKSGSGNGPAVSSAAAKKVEKDSVHCSIKDESGKPLAGISYNLKKPDGSIIEGKSDAKGEINLSGINPGTCEISFPELHEDEWKLS